MRSWAMDGELSTVLGGFRGVLIYTAPILRINRPYPHKLLYVVGGKI